MICSLFFLGDSPVPPKENLQTKVKKIQGFQIQCVNENILCVQKRLPYYFNWGSIWARWLGLHEEIDWPEHLSSRLQQCFLFLFLISQSGKLLLIKTHFTLEKQVLSRFFSQFWFCNIEKIHHKKIKAFHSIKCYWICISKQAVICIFFGQALINSPC